MLTIIYTPLIQDNHFITQMKLSELGHVITRFAETPSNIGRARNGAIAAIDRDTQYLLFAITGDEFSQDSVNRKLTFLVNNPMFAGVYSDCLVRQNDYYLGCYAHEGLTPSYLVQRTALFDVGGFSETLPFNKIDERLFEELNKKFVTTTLADCHDKLEARQ